MGKALTCCCYALIMNALCDFTSDFKTVVLRCTANNGRLIIYASWIRFRTSLSVHIVSASSPTETLVLYYWSTSFKFNLYIEIEIITVTASTVINWSNISVSIDHKICFISFKLIQIKSDFGLSVNLARNFGVHSNVMNTLCRWVTVYLCGNYLPFHDLNMQTLFVLEVYIITN